MAVPTNTLLTYAAVGIREDLSDVVTNIAPVDSEIVDGMANTANKVKNIKHEWLTDTLAAAGSNKHLQGDNESADAITACTRRSNNHQIQKKKFNISGSAEEATSPEGVTQEDYQTAKFLKELKKDQEWAALRGTLTDGAAATEPEMRGVLNWITTNVSRAGDSTINTTTGVITGGTARDLSEALVKDVRQNIFTAGGNPKIIYCGPFQKRRFTGFAGAGNYRTPVEKGKMMSTVDVYVDEFGLLTIKPHRIIPADVVLIYDKEYWKKAIYRKVHREILGKTGDNTTYVIRVEWTVEAGAENSSGRIVNLTTE